MQGTPTAANPSGDATAVTYSLYQRSVMAATNVVSSAGGWGLAALGIAAVVGLYFVIRKR
jgi:hypothetical protein